MGGVIRSRLTPALIGAGLLVLALGSIAQAVPANDEFRVSRAGGVGSATSSASASAIAYNEDADEYLVAWVADDAEFAGVVDNELEIYARRLDGEGDALGQTVRVSDAGGSGSTLAEVGAPSVAYNSRSKEYLIVWSADDTDNGGVVNDEFEIYGQRLSDTAAPVGNNDFPISDAGGTGSAAASALSPRVAYNVNSSSYLVVWRADDTDTAGIIDDEFEIFAQRLSPTGVGLGADFRLSDAGGTGSAAIDAGAPAIAYSPAIGVEDYLVVWQANDTDAGLVAGESEVFGQLVDITGAETGTNDFRISDAGGTGVAGINAARPSIAYNPTANEFLVAWEADDTDIAGIVNDELEIFGQRLSAAGAALGTNDFRVSDAGGNGAPAVDAGQPSVAHNAQANEYLVVWDADDSDAGLAGDELEIFGQRLSTAGAAIGTNDFRVSTTGGPGSATQSAAIPSLTYNSQRGEHLIAWTADDPEFGLANDEFEVVARRLAAPLNALPPSIAGSPAVGGTLTCATGTWQQGATSFAYLWRRGGVAIPGATAANYVVTTADQGQTLDCRVTASNLAGSRTAHSAPVVAPNNANQTPGPDGADGAQGPTGLAGPDGAAGSPGAAGPQGPPGLSATVICKPKKRRRPVKIRCRVVFATPAPAALSSARLVRGDGVTVARATGVEAGERLVLRGTSSRGLRSGEYTLVLRRQLEGETIINRSSVALESDAQR
jgi:hypothetical protein